MIRPSRIDFAPPSIARRARQSSLAAWFGLVVSAILLIALAVHLLDLGQHLLAVQAQESALRSAASARAAMPPQRGATALNAGPSAGPSAALSAAALATANQSIARLNIPWRDLFQAVESAAATKVAVLVFEPDPRKNQLRLTVEGRSVDAMLAFVDRLQDQPGVQSIRLLHHETNAQDKNRPVRFQLELQWVEVAP
jgi:hypothetical protein